MKEERVPQNGFGRISGGFVATGSVNDAWADIHEDSTGSIVRYTIIPNPVLRSVQFKGMRFVPPEELIHVFGTLLGRPIVQEEGSRALERVLRLYRAHGFSLARIKSVRFSPTDGSLTVMIDEGVIDAIDIEGGIRTEDAFVLREFQIKPGDVFRIDRADRGVVNLTSTTLFDYVYLEAQQSGDKTLLIVRLKERPSQLARVGMRLDDERHNAGPARPSRRELPRRGSGNGGFYCRWQPEPRHIH